MFSSALFYYCIIIIILICCFRQQKYFSEQWVVATNIDIALRQCGGGGNDIDSLCLSAIPRSGI